MLRLVDERTAGGERFVDDPRQLDPLYPQSQLVTGDAADVHEIVDQPGHALDLGRDDFPGPLQLRNRRRLDLQDVQRVGGRSQRIPQLMSKDGQELVLLLIGLPVACFALVKGGLGDPQLARCACARSSR